MHLVEHLFIARSWSAKYINTIIVVSLTTLAICYRHIHVFSPILLFNSSINTMVWNWCIRETSGGGGVWTESVGRGGGHAKSGVCDNFKPWGRKMTMILDVISSRFFTFTIDWYQCNLQLSDGWEIFGLLLVFIIYAWTDFFRI